MKHKKADILIVKLFENRILSEEVEWLGQWLKDEENRVYFNRFVEINHLLNSREGFDDKKSLKEVRQRLYKVEKNRETRLNAFFKYAAIFMVLLGIGSLLIPREKMEVDRSADVVNNAIKSGSDQAVLTLEDGSKVSLHKGKTYTSKNAQSKGESLRYDKLPSEKAGTEISYNYLTVPRGGQFFIELSDGTRVWLNSESKLKYPVKFKDNQPRQVQLVYGEAYFEVSPSEEHHGTHFKVKVNQMKAEVLGTEFNIKAYRDEGEVTTTLVEGTVALEKENAKTILKPRQQAVLSGNATDFEINTVSSFNETLWREGIFSFKNKSLKEIMKVLSRWYDMEVIFKDPDLEKIKFTGNLAKKQPIEEIMVIMQETDNINYSINDKTLTIE